MLTLLMNYEELITITFRDGESLEGVLSYPEYIGDKRGVILCPPHPHFAGNMDNNIIKSLYLCFSEKGL
ncbi:MAG: hypothetical protein D6828_01810, partial [Nitrospirae bacterium]